MGMTAMRCILLIALAMTTCTQGRTWGDPDAPAASPCSTCHGSAQSPSPPTDTKGRSLPTLPGIGAHQAHLEGTEIAASVSCDTCHIVPASVEVPGHLDSALPAEVTFANLAIFDGLQPALEVAGTGDASVIGCKSTYCHGSTLNGGKNTTPVWNALDPTVFRACDACHGFPPVTSRSGAMHPDSTSCADCHGEVIGADGKIKDKSKHVDGTVQVSAMGCTSCHGSGVDPAPPTGTHGETEEGQPAVGAHQAHLIARHGLASKVVCSECHKVPFSPSTEGHIDNTPGAEVTFGTLGTHETQGVVYDPATRTCTNVYCHGATLNGGSVASPVWAPPDDASIACGACHGNPPPNPHPQSSACGRCHQPTSKVDGGLADASTHIDGELQVLESMDCATCHGSADNPAPPKDTAGLSDTALPTIGAHQSHLKALSGLSSAVACTTCHAVPTRVDSAGHMDGKIDVAMKGLAIANNSVATWSTSDARCTNTYCHGATLTGGSNTQPVWTKVDGTQAECGTCHSLPPAAPHPAASNCEACHADTAGPDLTIAHPANHINGTVETSGSCTSCHGGIANAAPPVDTQGRSDTTLTSVGAHQTHLNPTSGTSAPVACGACHPVPATVSSAQHDDGQVQVVFSGTASADGTTPAWDRGNAKCSGTYCHGNTLDGGTNTSPTWTKVGQDQAKCGSCHGLPPALPHPQSDKCGQCHTATMTPDGTIYHPELHVDGTVQVEMGRACDSCHGGPDGPQPPVDVSGRSDTTLVSVGAHKSHALGSRLFAAVACNECHKVPTATDSPGHVDTPLPAELSFGSIARSDDALPVWNEAAADCTNVYCHGATLEGGTHTTPVWTNVGADEVKCGNCHGLPPAPPHPVSTKCGQCHDTTDLSGAIVKPEQHVDGKVELTALGCASCHGSADNPAPPIDTTEGTETTLKGVGAHQSHLKAASNLSSPVTCTECHVVPKTTDDSGHLDTALPAELTFGLLATSADALPSWDGTTATCSNTYCHGATLTGGSHTTPIWTKVGSGEAACGTCHGFPPTGNHVNSTLCGNCHTQTATVDGKISHPEKHINGVVEVITDASCSTCHGNTNNAAPPIDIAGKSDTTKKSVGAHQSHMMATGDLSSPVACSECHKVPTNMADAGHMDSALPAEVTFGILATASDANPSWDETGATCTNSYCHGATLHGGTHTTPVWTRVGSGEAACGSCHGNPPPSPHPQSPTCAACHPDTVDADNNISNPDKHIDGIVQVSFMDACKTCHGNDDNPAPPSDTSRGTATTLRGVGAHQSHLKASSALSKPMLCDECHIVPADASSPGHIDGALPAEITWGTLSQSDGANPNWDTTSLKCVNNYCHGATLSGGSNTEPQWTKVGADEAACGTCHGLPPAAPHPNSTKCSVCHDQTVSADMKIAHPEKHVDGVVQVTPDIACNACHGGGDNPAPPVDTENGTSTSLRGVGAHQAHLRASRGLSVPVACEDCHLVPATVTAAGHIDTTIPAELTWGSKAQLDRASPSWNGTDLRCSNTYCHGSTLDGGADTAPKWTTTDGSQVACASCHGNPPPPPHVQQSDCAACHTTATSTGTIAIPSQHIDGQVQVDGVGLCSGCHGSPVNIAPPADTSGNAATSLRGVGAHRAHTTASRQVGRIVACTECHVVPTAIDEIGHRDTALPAELTWGPLATADQAIPAWNTTTLQCSNNYCHGGTLGGGTDTTPIWTTVDGSQVACGTCHGNPPPLPHPQTTECVACHATTVDVNNEISDSTKHINGVVETSVTTDCTACHGSALNEAPPVDTAGNMATTARGVGAHQGHVAATRGLSIAMDCVECHTKPESTIAVGHIDSALPAEIIFGTKSKLDTANPSWDAVNVTCNGTYCHGSTMSGGTDKTPVWTQTDGSQVTCASCHGNPPPPPHPPKTDCATCHPDADNAGHITDPSAHVNGLVDVRPDMACNACHGGATSDAPPVDTTGNAATSYRGVGAHQSHLTGSRNIGKAVACAECHVVPASANSVGHRDTALPAELTWGTLAKTDGASPAWNTATLQCSNNYCHGGTLGGGTDTTPVWTTTDGSQVACGTCHGSPPPLPHPQTTECVACHAQTVDANNKIKDATKHINGIVETSVTTDCTACHGSALNEAPPVDTAGNMATTARGVGAHQGHVAATRGLSIAMDCIECHAKPTTTLSVGHIDTALPAEIIFGTKSKLDTANPSWDTVNVTCNGTYCHGSTLTGGTDKTPVWTQTDGSQVTCASCHGNPPPPPHPPKTDCATCHQTATVAGGIAKPGQHIDGIVQVDGTNACSACHGSTTNNAPPVDTTGNSTTPFKGVGAHQSHLLASRGLGKAVACTECHIVPTTIMAAGHRDTPLPAELTWGSLARTDNAVPAWNASTLQCSNNYCHGGTLGGGTDTTPIWTTVDGSQVACGTCHGSPPALPHPQADNCYACHSETVNTLNQISTPANHVNGTVEMTATTDCSVCHGSTTNDAPPVDTHGSSSTALRSVGAHQPHMQGLSSISSPIACTQCHSVPATTLAIGHVDSASPAELTFGALAKTGGLTPAFSTSTFDCTNTWCHGAGLTLTGGSEKTPVWTTVNGSQDACGTCHASATSGMTRPHPVGGAGSTCATCHGTTMTNNTTFRDKALHVNGTVNIAAPSGQLACNGVCHGDTSAVTPANQAPPADTQGLTATTLKSVGAHRNHLTGAGNISAAMACNNCHPVPTAVPDVATPAHLNKSVDVSFTIANTLSSKVTGTTYNATAITCTKSYCHGGWTNSGATNAPNTVASWTNTTLPACNTMCHALPPSTGEHRANSDHQTACGRCHSEVAATSGTSILNTAAAKALHINGVPNVKLSGGTGETWNATSRSCNPSCHGADDWGARVLPP